MISKSILQYIVIAAALLSGKSNSNIPEKYKVVTWIVEKNSSLSISGQSNVNSFSCNIYEYARKDTLRYIDNSTGHVTITGEIEMDILSFDCHSNLITKDLRKTLKADQYPMFSIRFISLESIPILTNKTEWINGVVEVKLASIVKLFEVRYSFLRSGATTIQMNGTRNFRFSDFKLSPPKKLAGLIKVKDSFEVKFQLALRAV